MNNFIKRWHLKINQIQNSSLNSDKIREYTNWTEKVWINYKKGSLYKNLSLIPLYNSTYTFENLDEMDFILGKYNCQKLTLVEKI